MPYDDLRKGRVSIAEHAYFVTTVTKGRRPVFSDLYHARCVVQEMRRLQAEAALSSLAWVLMPDHLHWLFQLRDGWELAEVMKRLKARTAREINRREGSAGTLWQRAYYDHGLRENEDPLGIARYIVANPLRAGLVKRIEDYPHWDSHWLDE